MSAKISFRGGREMQVKMQRLAKEMPERMGRALRIEMETEVTEMKRRTPVDITPNAPHPGNLRNSLHVEGPEQRGDTVSVAAVTNVDYAIYVHENPDAYHPVGQWKFMESVLNESAPYMASRLARHLRLDEK